MSYRHCLVIKTQYINSLTHYNVPSNQSQNITTYHKPQIHRHRVIQIHSVVYGRFKLLNPSRRHMMKTLFFHMNHSCYSSIASGSQPLMKAVFTPLISRNKFHLNAVNDSLFTLVHTVSLVTVISSGTQHTPQLHVSTVAT